MPSLRSAAKIIGVHHATLRRWILNGEGPRAFMKPHPTRATYRISEKDLEAFVQKYSKGR
jgi:predicted site-specific integrase-resolvase